MQKAQHRHHASGSVEGTTLPRSPPLQRHAPGCSDEDKLLLQVDGPSRLLCLFLLLPPHVRTQSRRCIEGSMSSPPAERQAGVGPAHRLSAPSRVSIHGSADLRKEGRNNLAGEFGAEEEEQDIIYFL
ncbi:hypothetical protein ACQJBY_061423 [Aegilops geniculata]